MKNVLCFLNNGDNRTQIKKKTFVQSDREFLVLHYCVKFQGLDNTCR